MLKLLALAERLCGRSLATSVLEPLIADWDRERREALPATMRTWRNAHDPSLANLDGRSGTICDIRPLR